MGKRSPVCVNVRGLDGHVTQQTLSNNLLGKHLQPVHQNQKYKGEESTALFVSHAYLSWKTAMQLETRGQAFHWSLFSKLTSGFPPRMMSVPLPAILVAIMIAHFRPACATISASLAAYCPEHILFQRVVVPSNRCAINLLHKQSEVHSVFHSPYYATSSTAWPPF